MSGDALEGELARAFAEIGGIGQRGAGGYERLAWSAADLELRDWFSREAARRGLEHLVDHNGNCWAWLGDPGPGAVLTGSHLDSVVGGGPFDGPLGVVSGFLALDECARRGVEFTRPVAVIAFCDEEGGRFGNACLGSRLATGAMDPARAASLRDATGTTLAEAMRAAGADPGGLGPDDGGLADAACYVELHVEQGRGLVHLDAPVGLATSIWPHDRWRVHLDGEANHAGTTPLEDRRDPMLALAAGVFAARAAGGAHGGRATLAHVAIEPNQTNAVPSRVDAWLDARAPDAARLEALVSDVRAAVFEAARGEGVAAALERESAGAAVDFDAGLRRRIAGVLGGVPELSTGAGHDAGILSAVLPSAMLFVRNPTGVSHSPAEHADPSDCAAGVRALADVLGALGSG